MASSVPPPSASSPPSNSNPSNRHNIHVPGYPKLAYFLAHTPRYLHLRRFGALSIRVLLHRQHELIVLENRLLHIEQSCSTEPVKGEGHFYTNDFGTFQTGIGEQPEQSEQSKELQDLYATLEKKTEKYEEALIRFDRLGLKGVDAPKLQHVQRFLSQRKGCANTLCGVDARVWAALHEPGAYATDLIRVLELPERNRIYRYLEDKFPYVSRWLQRIIFFSKSNPDTFDQYSYDTHAFGNMTSSFGNMLNLALAFFAISGLYYYPQNFGVPTVLTTVSAIGVVTLLFQNWIFSTLLVATCAVPVALITNIGQTGSR